MQTGANVVFCQQAIIIEMRVGQALRDACFEHLQRLPLSYFNTTPVGYIVARVMSDTNQLGTILSWRLADFIWNLFYLVFAAVSMLLLSWRLALLALLVAPPSQFQPEMIKQKRRFPGIFQIGTLHGTRCINHNAECHVGYIFREVILTKHP